MRWRLGWALGSGRWGTALAVSAAEAVSGSPFGDPWNLLTRRGRGRGRRCRARRVAVSVGCWQTAGWQDVGWREEDGGGDAGRRRTRP